VSWQLASFALVLSALALALWWYERSRPPAKLIAVLATLGALAALGRDAFAAVPDVKPITAIVMISGLAFGAGPGFAVGAVAALASNILLGEGPWTPWQMLAWGIVGLLGAALGRLASRRPPALVLALACAAAAEVFNLILDLYTWTGTGSHSAAGFAVVLGAALAFDLTHVIASFVFALAFGPTLLRMLDRLRARLEVSWQPLPLALLLCLPALSLAAIHPARAAASTRAAIHPARAAASTRAASAASSTTPTPSTIATAARLDIAREVSFLARAQNSDGGFGGAPGQSSSELYSAWVAIGLAAAGRDPLSLRRGGHTVLDALRGEAAGLHGVGDLERTILALHACGASLSSLPGGDPVTRLLGARSSDGSFGHLANLTAFAVLALRAAGYPAASAPLRSAGRWLLRQQEHDGGFGFATRGAGSDVDDTAAVVEALVAAGARGSAAVGRATAFLARAQNLDGGLPQQAGGSSNAQSSSWAIQALSAAGRDVARVHRRGSRSPLGYLESLIAPDGSVRYSRTGAQTPVWVTAQALTALAGKPFPIAAPHARASAARVRPAGSGKARAARVRSAAGAAAVRGRASRAGVLARALGALIGALRGSVLALALSGAL
jgi:energy-coupling factor transport system substrate-specific component